MKLKTILFLIATILILTGCGKHVEIEDRAIALAMSIDLVDEDLSVTYTFPDMDALTGQGGNNVEKLVKTITGTSLYEVEEAYSTQSSKRLDYGQMQAVIFSSNVLKNQRAFKEILLYLQNNNAFSRTILVFATEGKASDITKLDGEVRGSIGSYLDELYNNNILQGNKRTITSGTLINSLRNVNQVESLPILIVKDNLPTLSGAALLKGTQYIKSISDNVNEILILSIGGGVGNSILLQNNNQKNTIEFKKINCNYDFIELDTKAADTPSLKMTITIKGEARLQLSSLVNDKILNVKQMNEIENALNNTISNNVKKELDLLLNENKIDFTNSYNILGIKDRTLWIKYVKNNPADYEKSLDIEVISKVRLFD